MFSFICSFSLQLSTKRGRGGGGGGARANVVLSCKGAQGNNNKKSVKLLLLCGSVCVCVWLPAEVLGQAQNCTIMQNEEARERGRAHKGCLRERQRWVAQAKPMSSSVAI